MGRKILLSIFASVSLFALDINEAISSAIENNYSLKQQQYILEESQLNLDSSYSGYKPKVNLNYTYNDRDKLITGQIKKDSTLSTSISYNLFNGLKDKYSIDANKELFTSSKYTFEANKQDLILDVKTKYINYLLKQKNKLTMQEALKLYEKQYIDSKNHFDQGLIAQNELLEVEVQMLQSKQELQNAKANLKIAKQELENVIGKKISNQVESIVLDDDIVYDSKNIENRSEIRALEFMVKSYKNQVKATRSGFMPKVDASFSLNKYGDDFSPSDRVGYPDSQSIGTLTLNWNLYNGNVDRTSTLINKKKANQLLMQLNDLKQKIDLQFQNTKEQLDVSKLNLITAIKALDTSKLNYEIVSNKVSEGISSNKDLIDANYLLTKSKQNYFNAYYNRYLNIATIQRVLELKNDR